MEVFREKRRQGKTIVLVTHDMTTVQTLCHRAMLLHDGELRYIGEPEDAALRYYRLNFASVDAQLPDSAAKVVDVNVRIVHAALRDAAGTPAETFAQRDPIALDVVLEAARPLAQPIFSVHVRTEDGQTVFDLIRTLDAQVEPGRRIALAGAIDNRLRPGRYSLDVYIRENAQAGGMTVQGLRLLQFSIAGTTLSQGLVDIDADVAPRLLEDDA
jgi:energy-coupling factor transporter ATP-binding protein EcfA2